MAAVRLDRLKTRRDFLRFAGQRRKWVTPGLILQAAPMPPADAETAPPATDADENGPTPPRRARVGFTVSKKVGNAVARNRARRRLKAAAAELMPHLATGATDYVVIGRGMTLDRPWDALKRDLETALRKVLTAPIDRGPPRRKGKGGAKGSKDGRKPRRDATERAERTTGR